jgi:AcrR family transcriptional regulator
MPRAYHSPGRELAAAATRARIIESSRATLSRRGPITFTIDAIAERAGVARMTVYNQFGSKRGLVEALSDDLAKRGGIARLSEAFRTEDALRGLEILVEVFTGFWAHERTVLSRLRAVIALDPELSRSNRDARRRQALIVVLGRLSTQIGQPAPGDIESAADLLLVLTSFDAHESLRAAGRGPDDVAQLIIATAKRILGIR